MLNGCWIIGGFSQVALNCDSYHAKLDQGQVVPYLSRRSFGSVWISNSGVQGLGGWGEGGRHCRVLVGTSRCRGDEALAMYCMYRTV